MQFYPKDQRSSIQTPAPSTPTVYHLYCTSCIKHTLFLACGRLSLGHVSDFGSANFPPYSIGTLKVSGTSQSMSKSNRLWPHWTRFSQGIKKSSNCQRTLLGQLAMCVNDATTRLCDFELAEISTLLPFDSLRFEGKLFFNCYVKWNACWIGMDLGWFGCVCCPAAWELLRAGSTCPCQNMHRDIIPCNSLLGQKGVEKSCWLESWMLSMAFHNAVWLISTVKIQELFPSCTGMTKETWTTLN